MNKKAANITIQMFQNQNKIVAQAPNNEAKTLKSHPWVVGWKKEARQIVEGQIRVLYHIKVRMKKL